MFHEEKVINGILCYRTSPLGDFVAYSIEALTTALIAERSRTKAIEASALRANETLERVRSALAARPGEPIPPGKASQPIA